MNLDDQDDMTGATVEAADGSLVSLTGFIERAEEAWDKVTYETLVEGLRNERWMVGDQWSDIAEDYSVGTILLWNERHNRFNRNYLGNLSQTWAARFTKDRRRPRAWPNEASFGDMAAAEVANAVLDHWWRKADGDELVYRAVMLALAHGTVGMKVVWDPYGGPKSPPVPMTTDDGMPVVDEMGQPVMMQAEGNLGDVRIDIVTPFDFVTDGSQHIEDSKFVIFRGYRDRWDAQFLLEQAGYDNPEDMIQEIGYDNPFDEAKKGVLVREIWHRPTTRFPDGFMATLVGSHLVDERPFPYEDGELPLSLFKIRERRESPLGSTHVSDCVPIQREINEITSIRVQRVRELANTKLLALQEIAENYWGEDEIIICSSQEMVNNGARYLEPPIPSALIETEIANKKQELYDIFGINELMTGAQTMGTRTPGKSLAFMMEIDSQKMSGPIRSYDKCMRRVFGQVLSRFKQYVGIQRIVQIVGENDMPKVYGFVGADLDGVDVILEPGSNHDSFRQNNAAAAQDAAASGNLDPYRADEMMNTGLEETAWESHQRARAAGMVGEILRGGDARMEREQFIPAIAIEALTRGIEQNQSNQNVGRLYEWLQWFQQQQGQNQGPPSTAPIMPTQQQQGF